MCRDNDPRWRGRVIGADADQANAAVLIKVIGMIVRAAAQGPGFREIETTSPSDPAAFLPGGNRSKCIRWVETALCLPFAGQVYRPAPTRLTPPFALPPTF